MQDKRPAAHTPLAAFVGGILERDQKAEIQTKFSQILCSFPAAKIERLVERVDELLSSERRLYLPSRDDDHQRLHKIEQIAEGAKLFHIAIENTDTATLFM